MNPAVLRVRDFFLEVHATPVVESEATARAADRFAVLGRPSTVEAPAAALALRTARATGADCALLARWGASGQSFRLPPGRAASQAARALQTRELRAVASGRLVRIDVGGASLDVRSALLRAGAVIEGPVVLALGLARDAAVDRVLAEQDGLRLVGDPDELVDRLAADSLASLGPPVEFVPASGRRGWLTRAGVLPVTRQARARAVPAA